MISLRNRISCSVLNIRFSDFIHVRGDFDDYAKFPPYLDSEEAKEHIRTAYAGQDIEAERNTKAHMTDDDVPLQIIVLNRPKGAITKAHYHVVEERTTNTTRHQILLCQRGKVRVGVFTKEGGNPETDERDKVDLK